MGFFQTITLLVCLTQVNSLGNVPTVPPTPEPPVQINSRQPTAQPTAQPTIPPTFAPDPSIFAVSFEDFAGSCSASSPTKKTCFTDGNGQSYRFGCKSEDGNKVYTDTCKGGCNPANCDNNWKWLGDEANQCTQAFGDDTFFKYTCHAPDAGNAGPGDQEAVDAPFVPKTCNELGWVTSPASDQVCAASAVINGRCSGNVNIFAARKLCSRIGARLCTSQEIAADEAKGSGCKYDCERVWTGSKCTTSEGGQGFLTLAGARKCSAKLPSRCDDFESQDAVVRCCADAGTGDESLVKGPQAYPLGYSAAFSMDYPIADGECGKSAPVKQYSCWVNPAGGTSQRFACRPGSNMVWAQSCGTSANCELCQGTWFTQDEEIGKCYSTDEFLYSYKCK